MDYIITLDEFSGPMDLLLHLIKESNIDIYDIRIEDITKQYLDYIHKMEELNLNIASSYLVMAAELIEMKASMLLPKPVLEEEMEEDPRERLIQRLIAYQNYKEMTSTFHELEEKRKEYFTKEPSDLSEYDISSSLPEDIDLSNLLDAFQKFLERQELEKPLNTKITTKEYSIQERSKEIKQMVKKLKNVHFEELFETFEKSYIIVTFLSILVLAKNKEIAIKQDDNFKEITLCEVGMC